METRLAADEGHLRTSDEGHVEDIAADDNLSDLISDVIERLRSILHEAGVATTSDMCAKDVVKEALKILMPELNSQARKSYARSLLSYAEDDAAKQMKVVDLEARIEQWKGGTTRGREEATKLVEGTLEESSCIAKTRMCASGVAQGSPPTLVHSPSPTIYSVPVVCFSKCLEDMLKDVGRLNAGQCVRLYRVLKERSAVASKQP